MAPLCCRLGFLTTVNLRQLRQPTHNSGAGQVNEPTSLAHYSGRITMLLRSRVIECRPTRYKYNKMICSLSLIQKASLAIKSNSLNYFNKLKNPTSSSNLHFHLKHLPIMPFFRRSNNSERLSVSTDMSVDSLDEKKMSRLDQDNSQLTQMLLDIAGKASPATSYKKTGPVMGIKRPFPNPSYTAPIITPRWQ